MERLVMNLDVMADEILFAVDGRISNIPNSCGQPTLQLITQPVSKEKRSNESID
jgi:hypothetical protein